MDTITIRRVSFGSFVKLCAIISLSMGITLGVISFLASLAGTDVYMDWGFSKITGIPAGMAALPIYPLVFTILGINELSHVDFIRPSPVVLLKCDVQIPLAATDITRMVPA